MTDLLSPDHRAELIRLASIGGLTDRESAAVLAALEAYDRLLAVIRDVHEAQAAGELSYKSSDGCGYEAMLAVDAVTELLQACREHLSIEDVTSVAGIEHWATKRTGYPKNCLARTPRPADWRKRKERAMSKIDDAAREIVGEPPVKFMEWEYSRELSRVERILRKHFPASGQKWPKRIRYGDSLPPNHLILAIDDERSGVMHAAATEDWTIDGRQMSLKEIICDEDGGPDWSVYDYGPIPPAPGAVVR